MLHIGGWLHLRQNGNGVCCLVSSYYYDYTTSDNVWGNSNAVRPIVCIPTTIFNAAIDDGTYTLTDE